MREVNEGQREVVDFRVGVLGGGQLGRMMALAGRRLGIRFRFLEPKPEPPVAETGQVVKAAYDDADALPSFADGLGVVTYEFENVPARAADWLAERLPLHPRAEALATSSDRAREKALFRDLGIETAPYALVSERRDLERAAAQVGFPGVLKRRTLGYDGKGQARVQGPDDLDGAWSAIEEAPAIYERLVDFHRELSVLGVRGADGELRVYPLAENDHRDGILVRSTVPAPSSAEIPDPTALATSYLRRLMERLDYVGVLALELFQRGEELLANEFAPRVHNSGHWSLDGAVTDQFENHVRAVAGLPLGETDAVIPTVMVNVLGAAPALPPLLRVPGAHVHMYEKPPRPGRKLGHVNVCARSRAELDSRVRAVVGSLEGG